MARATTIVQKVNDAFPPLRGAGAPLDTGWHPGYVTRPAHGRTINGRGRRRRLILCAPLRGGGITPGTKTLNSPQNAPLLGRGMRGEEVAPPRRGGPRGGGGGKTI